MPRRPGKRGNAAWDARTVRTGARTAVNNARTVRTVRREEPPSPLFLSSRSSRSSHYLRQSSLRSSRSSRPRQCFQRPRAIHAPIWRRNATPCERRVERRCQPPSTRRWRRAPRRRPLAATTQGRMWMGRRAPRRRGAARLVANKSTESDRGKSKLTLCFLDVLAAAPPEPSSWQLEPLIWVFDRPWLRSQDLAALEAFAQTLDTQICIDVVHAPSVPAGIHTAPWSPTKLC